MTLQIGRRALIGSGLLAAGASTVGLGRLAAQEEAFPDEVLNPVEVSGRDAIPVIGRLPGAQRMYLLQDGQGEHHQIGRMTMTRIARPLETGGGYELMTFRGPSGAEMPLHAHLTSHAAFLVMEGVVELEMEGRVWRMLRGDFANLPPGTAHAWTMRSDRSKVALFTMGSRAGAGFVAMGSPARSAEPVAGAGLIEPNKLARAAMASDFQLRPRRSARAEPVRASNLILPDSAGAYVLADGGGERFGGNTFCARNANTGGQFLFLMTEGGGVGPGIGAHFHARHTEDFFALDGETAAWAYGQDVRIKSGDFIQAPPRHLHGFRMMQPYNRFVGFLTPGIFETFFTRGQPGRNGVGGRGAGEGAQPAPARAGAPPGSGPPGGGRPGGGAPGGDMFRSLAMSARGPDGWPLDVHGAKLPLPPQAPIWQGGRASLEDERLALIQHADTICGGGVLGQVPLSRDLRAALALKPRPEDFI